MGLRVEVDIDETLPARFLDAIEAGLDAGAELLLARANVHVPIEDDELEQSGKASRTGTTAAVSYDTPYAVIQHEKQDFKHDAGRTAKWLENAAVNDAEAVFAEVASTTRERLAR